MSTDAARAMERATSSANASSASSTMPREVDWNTLDKRKFFVTGVGVFSGVTAALYPLSVIKTRQMVSSHATQARAVDIVKEILKERGARGLYRGFGTIVVGAIPIRVVYLSTLEAVKAQTNSIFDAWEVPNAYRGAADAAGGATASLVSQALAVPVDIISTRQMVQGMRSGGGVADDAVFVGYRNGFDAVRQIVNKEGIRGLYRGFGVSVATLVPGSALWWGFYGTYKRALWDAAPEAWKDEKQTTDAQVMAIQAASGVCAGMSSGFLTTPLDILKTRLQVLSGQPGGESHTLSSTIQTLYKEHGALGFFRGVRPRMISVSVWGTTMVTVYEYTKRLARVDTD
jgi:solute carrier family 25 protein 44